MFDLVDGLTGFLVRLRLFRQVRLVVFQAYAGCSFDLVDGLCCLILYLFMQSMALVRFSG